MVLFDDLVEVVVDVIVLVVWIEKIGDGKIFIMLVEQVICIWIGEIGDDVV